MFKKSALVLALSLGVLSAPSFAASSVPNTFNVGVTLTPKCELFASGAATTTIGDIALTYTSFQTTDATASTSFALRCTNNQAYTLTLDAASVTDGTTGLAYTLNLTTASAHATGTTATTGSTSSASSGAGLTYYIHSTIASGQAGNVTAGTANNVRTLTIAY